MCEASTHHEFVFIRIMRDSNIATFPVKIQQVLVFFLFRIKE